MRRSGDYSMPDDDRLGTREVRREAPDSQKFDMAARVADRAAGDVASEDLTPPDEQRTWGKSPDPSYQQALDDIALLVDLRRDVSEQGTPPSNGSVEANEDEEVRHWGPFELVTQLGGGASGEVYKVRDKLLGNFVALKLFHEERVASVKLGALLVEGRRHALVKHPNIAVIHGADENDGRVGIWMEYIDGSTLQQLVEDQGTFGAAEAINIGRELCSALAAVHRQGLTHGDIKAQNVMREKGGRIVLMDFSSSRQVELDETPGGLVGTPIYMAPELFEDSPSNFSTDIYALGVLLFYLVTGRHPYEGRNLRELERAVAEGKPLLLDDLRSDLPGGFVRAVHKAIAWAPDDRFQSAGEFRAALRDALSADAVSVRSGVTPAPGSSAALAGLAGFGAAAGGLFALTFVGFVVNSMYRISLQIPRGFSPSTLIDHVTIGLRSSIAVAWDLARLSPVLLVVILAWFVFRKRLVRAPTVVNVRKRLLGADALLVAAAFVALGAVCLTVINAVYWDILDAMFDMYAAETITEIDVTPLAAYNWPRHQGRTLVYSAFIMCLVVGAVMLAFHLRRRAAGTAPLGLLSIGTVFVLFFTVVIHNAPWRLLWANESRRVEFQNRPAYVVATKAPEIFLYAPTDPEKSHYIVRESDPRIDWGEDVVMADLFEHLETD